MRIQPFGDRVVVKVLLPDEKMEGGLLLAPVSKDKSNRGEVVAVGEEVKVIAVRDEVLFNLGAGVSYSTESEDYKVLNEKDILGKILGE